MTLRPELSRFIQEARIMNKAIKMSKENKAINSLRNNVSRLNERILAIEMLLMPTRVYEGLEEVEVDEIPPPRQYKDNVIPLFSDKSDQSKKVS